METNISNATIEYQNMTKFYELLRQCDPELFLIKIALQETGLNPMLIPKIIRALSNLAIGTGYGKIQIFMQSKVITQIQGTESTSVNEDANK